MQEQLNFELESWAQLMVFAEDAGLRDLALWAFNKAMRVLAAADILGIKLRENR
jgi:hypothetical protein